jgi:hypothetical protein
MNKIVVGFWRGASKYRKSGGLAARGASAQRVAISSERDKMAAKSAKIK